MKLAFPNGEHGDVMLTRGALSIGNSAQDNIKLDATGVQANHLRILFDRRGLTLHVTQNNHNVKVNRRPVSFQAILRLGDEIDIAGIPCILRGEVKDDPIPETEDEAETKDTLIARAHMRAMNGSHAGKLFALPKTPKGSKGFKISDGSLGSTVSVKVGEQWVAAQKDGSIDMNVNGNPIEESLLFHGDQLTVGRHRFCLEAPGLLPRMKDNDDSALSGHTQVFKVEKLNQRMKEAAEQAERKHAAEQIPSTLNFRDRLVLAGCLLVSLAMLVYLGFKL